MMEKVQSINDLIKTIETLVDFFHNDKHHPLYEKVMLELTSWDFKCATIKIKEYPLYRIRVNHDNHDPFLKIEDLHYAPSKNVCHYGRANKPGQSMFYASESLPICELELLHDYLIKNDVGTYKFATYSKWKIKKELNLMVLALPPKTKEISNGFDMFDKYFSFIDSKSELEQIPYLNLSTLTSDFFLRNAKNDESVYIVCSAIANYFSVIFSGVDGFIYPSVQGNMGYNFVLKPHTVDKNMIVLDAVAMKKWHITSKNSKTNDPNFIAGQIKDQVIEWS